MNAHVTGAHDVCRRDREAVPFGPTKQLLGSGIGALVRERQMRIVVSGENARLRRELQAMTERALRAEHLIHDIIIEGSPYEPDIRTVFALAPEGCDTVPGSRLIGTKNSI